MSGAVDYRCTTCGYRSPKWMGFCPQCRSEGELVREEARRRSSRSTATAATLSETPGAATAHVRTGLAELDRVLGGGLVPGAAILLGGEPGVGKSTLILQVAGLMEAAGRRALLASAEESIHQVKMRAGRLGVTGESVSVLSEPDIDAIIETAAELRPDLLVVDSIQTVTASELGSSPGGVAQVRECGGRVCRFAKDTGIPVVLVGHVTKEGGLAGPKVLEHMVDVVLYLEGEQESGLRLVRGLKNRFGATHQVGLFEMGEKGLSEVADPSGALIGDWTGSVPGSVVFPTVEGRRPVLVELQALVTGEISGNPRRSVKGIEAARVHQLLAVLERHAGLAFINREVYVNVVGGVRVREPAADLPVALAIASSLLGRPLGSMAAWGEVGLTGEVRPVGHDARRREEVGRLGIRSAVHGGPEGVSTVGEALDVAGLDPSGIKAAVG